MSYHCFFEKAIDLFEIISKNHVSESIFNHCPLFFPFFLGGGTRFEFLIREKATYFNAIQESIFCHLRKNVAQPDHLS